MKFRPSMIPDVVEIQSEVHGDHRGFFMETWHRPKFAAAGIDVDFVQDNHSMSRQGILRGLHYQLGRPQGKLVRVVVGEVYDVAVDLRRSSPTFGRWFGTLLSAEAKNQLWVPPGFAHGFYVTRESTEIVYKCTQVYAAADERVIRWDDPDLSIDWPLLSGAPPVLSARDAAAPAFCEAECFS